MVFSTTWYGPSGCQSRKCTYIVNFTDDIFKKPSAYCLAYKIPCRYNADLISGELLRRHAECRQCKAKPISGPNQCNAHLNHKYRKLPLRHNFTRKSHVVTVAQSEELAEIDTNDLFFDKYNNLNLDKLLEILWR